MNRVPDQLDHLVFAGPDLARAIAVVEDRLGTRVVPGGEHPRWGTRNAILPLGPASYLEIIGPNGPGDRPTIFGIHTLQEPRLVTWAAATDDLALIMLQARALDIALGERQSGRRVRQDGSALTWELTDPMSDREGGVIPFFIDWKGGRHPATEGPPGAELVEFAALHPRADDLSEKLDALSVPLTVHPGPAPRLIASFLAGGRTVQLT